jgi:hypothetical protein
MKRKTGLAIGAGIAATAAIAGCGTVRPVYDGTPANAASGAGPSSASRAPYLTPKQRAGADVASTLTAFVAPPGATRLRGTSGVPKGTLSQPASEPLTPDLVDDVSWWHAPGQPQALLTWEKSHLPRRFSSSGGGTGDVGQAQTWSEEFSLPGVPGVLTQRDLQVQAVADGADQTLIRVDALDTWVSAKPATEKVPSTATVVTIATVPGLDAPGKPLASATVTDPSKVKGIAALIDGLPVFPSGTYSCPADTGRALRLTFRSSAHGPVVAVATASTGGCLGVSLVVGGKSQPGLWQDGSSVTQALKIAGVTWPGY